MCMPLQLYKIPVILGYFNLKFMSEEIRKQKIMLLNIGSIKKLKDQIF